MSVTWSRGQRIRIVGPQGGKLKKGYVRGLWGVDKRDRRYGMLWVLTHLPSGYRVGTFKRLRDAKKAAAIMEDAFSDCESLDAMKAHPASKTIRARLHDEFGRDFF